MRVIKLLLHLLYTLDKQHVLYKVPFKLINHTLKCFY